MDTLPDLCAEDIAGSGFAITGYTAHPARTGTRASWRTTTSPGLRGQDGQRLLVAVNYAGNRSQCYVRLPFTDLEGHSVQLKDLMGAATYDRDGADILARGLFLDLPPWGYHIFELTAL